MCASMRCELMVDRAQLQIILHGLEGSLDLDELDIELPQLGGVFSAQIGAQEIASFAPPHLAQLFTIECEAERGAVGSHFDVDQTPRRPRLATGGAELHEQFLTIEVHGRDLLEARP